MKFKDIPQFTKPGRYKVDIPWGFLKDWLKSQEELNLQLNPDFQRGHVWTEKQQIAYIEYIIKGGKSGRDLYFNCKGWMNKFEGPFVCVDGLQRLTAVLQFLNNQIKIFGYYYSEYEDKLSYTDCYFSIIVNDLKDKKDILKWYLEMNTGGTVHTDEEINKVKDMLNKELK